ncbi:PAS domain-containing hybrid sensor histidine kinase/response regulator [Eionea flava]
MLPAILFIVLFLYIALLFLIAKWGDQQYFHKVRWIRHPIVYALALGVYCTSWTFYGLVGTASEKGWNFFPILLGPILLFTLGYPLLERIYRVCRQEHIHSVADFIASRYGKRQSVAATVSIVVLIATIPYIALQLKAVSDTLLLTLGDNFLATQDLTFVIALCMMAFTLSFGVKRLDVSGYHSGLMTAIAFESLVKLVVLIFVSALCFFWLAGTPWKDMMVTSLTSSSVLFSGQFYQPIAWPRFITETLLAMCAIFCLPRMFHVTFVECLSRTHMRSSRWVFIAYLLLISVCIAIIATTGNVLLGNDTDVSADTYVIALPMSQGFPWVAMLAFLGGFSAATAMIIVSTMTLSHMLSNDVVLPIFLRGKSQNKVAQEFSQRLIFSRRSTVIFVIFAAYLYQALLAENAALTSIGLVAFALVVQLAPAILFGLYWKKGNVVGLYAGLLIGLFLWVYTLIIPLLASAGLISSQILDQGFLGVWWLRPELLFGLSFSDSFTRAVVMSLSANILFYIVGSLFSLEKLIDKVQAIAFTQLTKGQHSHYQDINTDDLRVLLREFVDKPVVDNMFTHYAKQRYSSTNDLELSRPLNDNVANDKANQYIVEQSQKILAGIVGVASAQSMIEGVCRGKKMAVEDVVSLFGETTKELRFKQEALSTSFEYVSSGISVVDADMRLIAWNSRYEEIFSYPETMLFVGIPVVEVMRFNISRHLFDEDDNDVKQRLTYMVEGKEYRAECQHHSDIVIEIKGRPLPNGGYVTTYDDITSLIRIQQGLEEMNVTLEERVQDRTQMIEEINGNLLKEILRRGETEIALREAKKSAEAANALKTKFLALASHDIMQPLNAASLYASALSSRYENQQGMTKDQGIIEKLQSSIRNTESIISTLLEISKVDHGEIKPQITAVDLNKMLLAIVNEASLQCTSKQLIRYCPTSVSVTTDQHYLYRVIQNLVSNAIKYTPSGKVLIGCRRVAGDDRTTSYVDICVLDTGLGISEEDQQLIFSDFYRVPSVKQYGADQEHIPGIGLGLSVVSRFSELLKHPVRCQSVMAKGSCFSVRVPVLSQTEITSNHHSEVALGQEALAGMVVAYVDDQPENLIATEVLLNRWHCEMVPLSSVAETRNYCKAIGNGEKAVPDIVLMDYQLGERTIDGITLAKEMQNLVCGRHESLLPICIVSASSEIGLPERVSHSEFEFLRKPVKPGRLRALLAHIYERRVV